jgi:hypothetical protein
MAAEHSNGYLGEALPIEPLPTAGERFWIDRPEELVRVGERLRGAKVLAIDAEFITVNRREPDEPSHRLALLQLAMPGSCFVIDAWRLVDLTPLQSAFADRTILKLFHGMGADTRVLADRQLFAKHTLDLEAVSRSIFGQRESGLAAMLGRAFGIRLDKSLQRSDWTRRPLPPAMIAYAARDAEATLALYEWLRRHYPWAVALYEDGLEAVEWEAIALWLQPFVRGERAQTVAEAVLDAGLSSDQEALTRDCRAALRALRYPNLRNRVLRVVADLGLVGLMPEVCEMLTAPAAEERAAAARTLGKLRIAGAADLIRPLLSDPVADVRQAAQRALEWLNTPGSDRVSFAGHYRVASGHWVVRADTQDEPDVDTDDWRSALRTLLSASEPEEGHVSGEE